MHQAVNKRVLIVEDNPLVRDMLCLALRTLQRDARGSVCFEVIVAGTGAEAWQTLLGRRLDLAIVDIYVPVLDGIELITRIRAYPDAAAMAVLAISASRIDARARSLEAGADRFLQKPLRLVDVVDAVASLLRLTIDYP